MAQERLNCLCTTRVDDEEKVQWVKIWNFDKDSKHATSFPIDMFGNGLKYTMMDFFPFSQGKFF